jgi:hypothetical protein
MIIWPDHDLEAYGNDFADRVVGTFRLDMVGEQMQCFDPPKCEDYTLIPITGVMTGGFDFFNRWDSRYFD